MSPGRASGTSRNFCSLQLKIPPVGAHLERIQGIPPLVPERLECAYAEYEPYTPCCRGSRESADALPRSAFSRLPPRRSRSLLAHHDKTLSSRVVRVSKSASAF